MTVIIEAMTHRALLEAATARLVGAGIATARADAEWLLAGLSGLGRAALAARLGDEVDGALAARYAATLARRERREPLQRILGWEEFCGLRFALTPDVLIPRPETERLVEIALTLLPSPAGQRPIAVDVGTGSGCIACAIAHQRPDVHVIALDHSIDALAVANQNARALGLDSCVRVVASTLTAALGPQQVDLIVANLPYLPTAVLTTLQPEVRDHDPRQALDGGPDGLNLIRPLITDATRTLKNNGALILETAGSTQSNVVATLLKESGFTNVAIHPDLTGTNRFVQGQWPQRAMSTAPSAGFARASGPGGRQGEHEPKARAARRKGGGAPLRAE